MKLIHLGKPLPIAELDRETPAWIAAKQPWIDRALEHALAQPDTGWYVVAASRAVTTTPRKYRVLGRELVAYRTSEGAFVAPAACPHMGADLACGRVEGDRLICPWHGLALGAEGHGAWKPYPTHDDGVLVWARIDPWLTQIGKHSDEPPVSPRPSRYLDAVVHMEAACEPRDVVANRLDPWHGVHFHPHSFASLAVLERTERDITVRVAYRALGPLVVEVDARFEAPTARSIVMTIVAGDGVGSVVETHATPIAEGRTAVIEATLATSDRWGFRYAQKAASLFRPFMHRRAQRLWVDDVAYAERLYAMRQSGQAQVKAPRDRAKRAKHSPS